MLRRRILRIKVVQALYAYGKQRQICLLDKDKKKKALSVSEQRTLKVEGLRAIKQDLKVFMDGYVHTVAVLRALWQQRVMNGNDAKEKDLYHQFVRLCGGGDKKAWSAPENEELRNDATHLWNQLENGKTMKARIRFITYWLKNETVFVARSKQDMRWHEHQGWIKETLVRQLKQLNKGETKPILDAKTIKKHLLGEGKDFICALFTHSLEHYEEVESFLKKTLKNWSIERLSSLDKAILHAATSEWRLFPKTPKQVVFDENIEIAKKYGTPNSPSFVNGMLQTLYDAYIKPLKKQTSQKSSAV